MQIGLEDRAESTMTLTGGGAQAELVDRGAAAVLRASELQDSTRGVGRRTRGQRGPRFHGGEQLLGSGLTSGDGFGRNPARHGVTRLWLRWRRR